MPRLIAEDRFFCCRQVKCELVLVSAVASWQLGGAPGSQAARDCAPARRRCRLANEAPVAAGSLASRIRTAGRCEPPPYMNRPAHWRSKARAASGAAVPHGFAAVPLRDVHTSATTSGRNRPAPSPPAWAAIASARRPGAPHPESAACEGPRAASFRGTGRARLLGAESTRKLNRYSRRDDLAARSGAQASRGAVGSAVGSASKLQ
jgi:hypothetical protein